MALLFFSLRSSADLWRLLLLPSPTSAQAVSGSIAAPPDAPRQRRARAGCDPASGQEQTEEGLSTSPKDVRIERSAVAADVVPGEYSVSPHKTI